MGPAGFFEASDEDIGFCLKEDDIDGITASEPSDYALEAWQGILVPNVYADGDIRTAGVPGCTGKERADQRDRQVVDTKEIQIFDGAEGDGLARTGEAGDDYNTGMPAGIPVLLVSSYARPAFSWKDPDRAS